MNKLEQLLKDLHEISHLSLSIFDIEANLVASYPDGKISFCEMIEHCPNACAFCKQFDHDAFEYYIYTNVIFIYMKQLFLYILMIVYLVI